MCPQVLLACPVSPLDDVNVFLGFLPRPQRVPTSGCSRDDGLSPPPLTLTSDVDLDLTLVAGELGPCPEPEQAARARQYQAAPLPDVPSEPEAWRRTSNSLTWTVSSWRLLKRSGCTSEIYA